MPNSQILLLQLCSPRLLKSAKNEFYEIDYHLFFIMGQVHRANFDLYDQHAKIAKHQHLTMKKYIETLGM